MFRPISALGQAERSRSIGRRASLRLMTAWLLAGAASAVSVGQETDKKKSVCASPAALGAADSKLPLRLVHKPRHKNRRRFWITLAAR
jgi:formate-dependent phosphoribosylglycinamide formyltransferase (GAR transformylase)